MCLRRCAAVLPAGAGVPGDDELAGDPDYRRHRTVYIVLGILYESYVHPLTIPPPCPRRASERCWRWSCSMPVQPNCADRDHVINRHREEKRIMMVDFALEAQRHGNLTPQELFSRPVCCVFARL